MFNNCLPQPHGYIVNIKIGHAVGSDSSDSVRLCSPQRIYVHARGAETHVCVEHATKFFGVVTLNIGLIFVGFSSLTLWVVFSGKR